MHPIVAAYQEDLELVDADHLPDLDRGVGIDILHLGVNEADCYKALRRIVDAGRPCRVVVHDPPSLAHSKRDWMESLARWRWGRGVRKLVNHAAQDSLDAQIARHVVEWVVLSQVGAVAIRDRLTSNLGVTSPNVRVVPLGLYPPVCRRTARTAGSIHIGMFGHLGIAKGFHILVEAFLQATASRDDLCLTLSGRPDSPAAATLLERMLRDARRRFPGKVSYVPGVPDDQLPALIDSFDVLAIPYRTLDSVSASGPMAWGWTRGCPIAATPSSYAKEFLNAGGGWLLDGAETDDWCRFLRGLTVQGIREQVDLIDDLRKNVSEDSIEKAWSFLASQ